LDGSRRISGLAGGGRADPQPHHAWQRWRAVREELFRSHPQSPSHDARPVYFDYAPALRVYAAADPAERIRREIATSGDEPYSFTRFGRVRFGVQGAEQTLDLYWRDGAGGGVFLCLPCPPTGPATYA